MKSKLKYSISVFLLLVFLIPTVIKLEHNHEHEHFICNAKSAKHFHDYHVKCDICKFEFSLYSKTFYAKERVHIPFFSHLPNFYISALLFTPFNLLFLLRAPPLNKEIA